MTRIKSLVNELTGRRIGYARVSTEDQNLDLQRDALNKDGCATIWEDKASGSRIGRRGLKLALDDLEPGDTLVVWKLDRLSRSIRDLLNILKDLEERGVAFRELTFNIDTSTATGRLFLHVAAAFAEFERGVISERTKAGMLAAKRRGRKVGNAQKITGKMVDEMQALRNVGWSAKRIADSINSNFGLRGPRRINYRSVYNYTVEAGSKRKPLRKRPND